MVYMTIVVEETLRLYCCVEVDNNMLEVCGNILEVDDGKLEFGCRWLNVQFLLVILLLKGSLTSGQYYSLDHFFVLLALLGMKVLAGVDNL